MLNSKIKDYHIQRELGRGGMAVVYLAHDQKFDTQVAVKVLNKEYAHNENIRKRFLAEARNMFKMSHPNIIKVTDLIDDGDTVAFVMEYIEGETLKVYLERKGKLTDDEIKDIFTQMLDAVGYVHKQNLVHRDIKPANFMLDREGKIKLLDFGIAKNTDANSAEYTQTGTGVQLGTPMYMSPEQISETKSVTAQSDIYSLGVVLWQMAAGRKPYDTQTLSNYKLQNKIVNEPLDNTNTQWDRFIRKATAKEMTLRYENAFEFKTFLVDLKSEKKNDAKDEKTVFEGDTNQPFKTEKREIKNEPISESSTIEPNAAVKDNSTNKKIKGFLSILRRILLWVTVIFIGVIILGILVEEPYPNSKEEMTQMLTNKCWKLDDVTINSIVINGKTIDKPTTSGARRKIVELFSDSTDRLIWEKLESSYNELIADKYRFIFFRNNSNGELYYYRQSFNKDISKPTSLFNVIEIDLIDYKYQFKLSDNNYEYTFDGEEVDSNSELKSNSESTIKIVGLSNDMLKMEREVKVKMDGTEMLLNITNKYKVIPANVADISNLNRVVKDHEDLIKLLDQTIEEAFDTLVSR